jgi:hypothetical protein
MRCVRARRLLRNVDADTNDDDDDDDDDSRCASLATHVRAY